MATRLTQARPALEALFESQPDRVFRKSEIGRLLDAHRDAIGLPRSLSVAACLEDLIDRSRMTRVRVDLPHRPETLYVWGEVSSLCIASSLKTGGFLSHYTAMQVHELTLQTPEVIYVNHEQRPQPRPAGPLTQDALDRAFRATQRVSRNVATLGTRRVCVLNGKHTGRHAIEERQDNNGHPVHVTSLERTLIDIVVRPVYSGGVAEILDAFRRAADRVQINRLLATLRKMDFVYPYHQAIGFYMEKSGAYPEKRLRMIESEGMDLDFHLTYAMNATTYSRRWRIHVPEGL